MSGHTEAGRSTEVWGAGGAPVRLEPTRGASSGWDGDSPERSSGAKSGRGLKAKLTSLDRIPGKMGRGDRGLEQGKAVSANLLLAEDSSSPSVKSAQDSGEEVRARFKTLFFLSEVLSRSLGLGVLRDGEKGVL